MLSDLIGEFPPEMREPLHRLMDKVIQELSDRPTGTEFRHLSRVVERLAESVVELSQAQKRTEARLDALVQRVDDLAQAQKRTEERLEQLTQAQKRTEERVEQLAQAQKRTEERVEQLTQAQKRTEERVEQLAQAQKHTEEILTQLIEAQIKTEERLNRLEGIVEKLVGEMKTIRKELGGLAHTFGYRLEDEAIWTLLNLLPRDFSVEVKGQLRRGFLTIAGGKTVEANIHGHGVKAGKPVTILGEAKSQLKKRDVDNFLSLVRLVAATSVEQVFPILVTYQTSPMVEEYARHKGVALYFSYQFKPF